MTKEEDFHEFLRTSELERIYRKLFMTKQPMNQKQQNAMEAEFKLFLEHRFINNNSDLYAFFARGYICGYGQRIIDATNGVKEEEWDLSKLDEQSGAQ